MKELVMESYGKVNLALDILYKRDDGYHEIRSIMQRINLKDRLIFKEIDKGIVIESSHPQMPRDSGNLVYKVWEALSKLLGIKRGIHVKIEKHIPMAAGLAGGSSNAAATLKALNLIWDLGLSDKDLIQVGKNIGADIPFCLMGGTALAQGIGEKLTRLKPFSGKYILLCKPEIKVSTAEAYGRINPNSDRLDIDGLAQCIEKGDIHCVASKMANKMEEIIVRDHPIIQEIKDIMIENGALGSIMSGSGPTVFGLYNDKDKMNFSQKKLLRKLNKVYMCETI